MLHNVTVQDHGIAEALDQELIKICRPALETGEAIRASLPIRNVDRTVGTILGHEVTKATRGEVFRTARSTSPSKALRDKASGPSCPPASRCDWKAMPTTIWPRDSQAVALWSGRRVRLGSSRQTTSSPAM